MRHGEKTVVQIKCQKALVVITSRFTKPAKELAFSNFVDLWDKEILSELLIGC